VATKGDKVSQHCITVLGTYHHDFRVGSFYQEEVDNGRIFVLRRTVYGIFPPHATTVVRICPLFQQLCCNMELVFPACDPELLRFRQSPKGWLVEVKVIDAWHRSTSGSLAPGSTERYLSMCRGDAPWFISTRLLNRLVELGVAGDAHRRCVWAGFVTATDRTSSPADPRVTDNCHTKGL
jgi:hypothetical protein